MAEPGRNTLGEDVVWVDYDNAVSMHRVRATDPQERRLERLDSNSAVDNRISYGCINIPVAFYDAVVRPVFGAGRGVVYVLPEVEPLHATFPNAYAPRHAGSRTSCCSSQVPVWECAWLVRKKRTVPPLGQGHFVIASGYGRAPATP